MPAGLSSDESELAPAKPETGNAGRVLVGGVGYRNLRDYSVGPIMAERLARLSWPPGVEIDDLSFGPIALVHRLREAQPYDRIVLVSAVARDRLPGKVYRYQWAESLPAPEEIQARVAEAVTGVISLDNLLVIGRYFDVLPEDVVVIEVEPVVEEWGMDFTPAVAEALDQVEALVREAALEPVKPTTNRDPTGAAPVG